MRCTGSRRRPSPTSQPAPPSSTPRRSSRLRTLHHPDRLRLHEGRDRRLLQGPRPAAGAEGDPGERRRAGADLDPAAGLRRPAEGGRCLSSGRAHRWAVRASPPNSPWRMSFLTSPGVQLRAGGDPARERRQPDAVTAHPARGPAADRSARGLLRDPCPGRGPHGGGRRRERARGVRTARAGADLPDQHGAQSRPLHLDPQHARGRPGLPLPRGPELRSHPRARHRGHDPGSRRPVTAPRSARTSSCTCTISPWEGCSSPGSLPMRASPRPPGTRTRTTSGPRSSPMPWPTNGRTTRRPCSILLVADRQAVLARTQGGRRPLARVSALGALGD